MKTAAAVLVGLALTSGLLCHPTPDPVEGDDNQTPSLRGLADLPGGYTQSYAAAVSGDGKVVVGWSNAEAGYTACRWDNGEISALKSLAGATNSYANAVSGDGSVVVGMCDIPGRLEACSWTGSGEAVALRTPTDGSFESIANGVSADGSVVVGFRSTGSFNGGDYFPTPFRSISSEPFRWTAKEGFGRLGELPAGHSNASAAAVSADGSVIIGGDTTQPRNFGFRWTAENGMVDLGGLLGAESFWQPHAISADGSVIVGQSSSAAGLEAFRWTADEGMVALGELYGGGQAISADAVSADGSVIVGRCRGSVSEDTVFIWDRAHGARDLHDVLVNDYGLEVSGWELGDATGISADGRTIVGTGSNPAGQTEGWIAHLAAPQPSSD